MKKCLYCGKKSGELILIDEDEEEYLCKGCSDKENKKVKERMDKVKEVFGYPSADRAMRIMKSWAGEFEDITIDKKNSVLPKWFLEKGLMNMYDFLKSRKDITREIDLWTKKANRKNRSKNRRKCDLAIAKQIKKDMKNFRIEYFTASDVEKLFRELIKDKSKK